MGSLAKQFGFKMAKGQLLDQSAPVEGDELQDMESSENRVENIDKPQPKPEPKPSRTKAC